MGVLAEIPVEPGMLRNLAVGLVVAIAVVALLVARFVTTLVVKVVTLAVLVGLGALVWQQRAELGDCARTCECSFFGQDVRLPAEARPVCDQIAEQLDRQQG